MTIIVGSVFDKLSWVEKCYLFAIFWYINKDLKKYVLNMVSTCNFCDSLYAI